MKKIVKKAQTGVTMATRDSIKAANRARVSKMELDRATKAGFPDVASYMKVHGYDPHKPQKPAKLEGTYTSKDTKRAEKADTVEGPSFISKCLPNLSGSHCIYTDEDKSGVSKEVPKKNGGTMKKAQNGTKVPAAKDTPAAKKMRATLDKQKAALKKKGYAKNGGKITPKKK